MAQGSTGWEFLGLELTTYAVERPAPARRAFAPLYKPVDGPRERAQQTRECFPDRKTMTTFEGWQFNLQISNRSKEIWRS